MENRVQETLWYLGLGIVSLIAGLILRDQSYSMVLFLLTAMFFLAIFRPSRFP